MLRNKSPITLGLPSDRTVPEPGSEVPVIQVAPMPEPVLKFNVVGFSPLIRFKVKIPLEKLADEYASCAAAFVSD